MNPLLISVLPLLAVALCVYFIVSKTPPLNKLSVSRKILATAIIILATLLILAFVLRFYS